MLSRRVAASLLALSTTVALVVSGCTNSGSQTETQAGKPMPGEVSSALEKTVKSALELSGSTQAMVAVWAPWSGDFVQGVTTDGSSLGIDTQFRAAQSSQAVICAALLSLVNDGELDLNRKVQKDLPRQVGIEGITYGQLCEGTSGLADYKFGFKESFNNNPARIWPEREIIAAGIVNSPLSKPGGEFHMSDTNAVLLGRALSIATGQDLAQILSERVFDNLDLVNSYYPEPTSLTLGGDLKPSAYPLSGGKLQCKTVTPVEKVSGSMLAGAGASITTVTNLRDFYAKYLSGSFESGSTKGLVQQTRPLTAATKDAAESNEKWGFGLQNIAPLWGNSGEITGTISAAFHDPKSGYSVVVVLNNSSAGAKFAELLALKLTSVVSEKAPGGLSKLSWDEAEVSDQLTKAAVCQD